MYKIKIKKHKIWFCSGNRYSYYEAINRAKYLTGLGHTIKIVPSL